MPKRKRFVLLSCLSLVNTLAFSHENLKSDAQECCGLSPRPQRLEIRHIESKGIGYRQGYTSIEGFFTPTVLSETSSWVPFIDLRGHIFDNNKLAANAGFGLRYLTSRVWGVNAYYDYRGTSHHGHFNQVGFGLESLGKIWDFRINGYLPFGKKRGHFFHTRFHEFSGHHMIISRKRESAMKGANAEIGAHIKKFTYGEFYAAAGPYYFEAEGKNTWGGEGRLALSSKHIKLQVSGSYDPVFHGIVQGELSLIFPFGEKKEIRRRNCGGCKLESYTCKQELTVRERALQKVDRFEIIVLDRKRHHSTAINPITHQPYFFWFVDNTSHSNGTFESPFNTLVAAQNASSPNDVIYVFPGDGTSTGMNAGITLKNGQKLFGAGIDQKLTTTAGSATIPALANSLPIITKSTNGIINCANNNEISGIRLTFLDTQAIVCSNINNAFIHNNFFDMHSSKIGAPTCQGVVLQSSGGQITVRHNIFNYDINSSFGVHIVSTVAGSNYFITNNQFISPAGILSPGFALGTGIEFGVGPNPGPAASLGNFNTLNISNNQFAGIGSKAIGGMQGFAGSGHLIMDGNNFFLTTSSPQGIVLLQIQAGGNIIAEITNNVWENTAFPTLLTGLFINVIAPTSSCCLTLTGNQSDIVPFAYFLNNTSGGTLNANAVPKNIGMADVQGVINIHPCP